VDNKLHDHASTVAAEQGQVLVSGPGGVALALTPDAAAETSDRLLDGAAEAQGQILEEARLAEEDAARKTS
jgi:hypothetical protein